MYGWNENHVVTALTRSVTMAMEEMAFLGVKRIEGGGIESEPAYFVNLQSPVKGALILSIPQDGKGKLAGNVYGKARSDISGAEIDDCILELVNVITAQFMIRLDFKKIQYILGVPKLIFRQGDLYSYPYSYDYSFEAEGIPFQIRLMMYRPITKSGSLYAPEARPVRKRASVMCIDGSPEYITTYRESLRDRDYDVETAASLYEALPAIKEKPPALIVLNTETGSLDGLRALRLLKRNPLYREIPVMMVSSADAGGVVEECFRNGADDFLTKPFCRDLLVSRVELHMKNTRPERLASDRRILLEREIQDKSRQLDDMKDAAILALAKLTEYRDPETASHLERIREYARIISKELAGREKYSGIIGIDFVHNIYVMSVLHDIGKVGIPDRILLKEGKLTAEEYECMKQHTVIGARALEAVSRKNKTASFIVMAKDIALHHHEKWDGTGYPHGLRGESIPLAARITTLADIFDALSTKRIYKEAFPIEEVDRIMEKEAASTFDPDVYDAYRRRRGDFIEVKARFADTDDAGTANGESVKGRRAEV